LNQINADSGIPHSDSIGSDGALVVAQCTKVKP
jgi:hypothetical protein